MKKRYALLVFIIYCVSMFIPMFAAPPSALASSVSINAAAGQMAEVYEYLDNTDRTVVLAVRAILIMSASVPNDSAWNSVVEPLLTPQVVAKFGGDKAKARREIIKFAAGMGKIRFSDDADKLSRSLADFKDQFNDDFLILFGKDVSLEQMCDMLLYTNEVLPQAAEQSSNVDNLLFGTNKQFLDAMRQVEITAMQINLSKPQNANFGAKLAAIGWTPEKLANQQAKLADRVDPTHLGEIALGKAMMRSLVKLYQVNTNGTIINSYSGRDIIIPLNNGSSLYCKLEVMDRDITKLALWKNSNSLAASMDPNNDKGKTICLTAKSKGTSHVTAYRDFKGSSPLLDWLLKFSVVVPGSTHWGH